MSVTTARQASVWQEAVRAIATIAAVLLALIPALHLVVQGSTWILPVTVTVAAVGLCGFMSRTVRRMAWPGWVLMLLVAPAAFFVIALPPGERWGPIPSPAGWQGLSEVPQILAAVIKDEVAPVTPLPEVIACLAALAALLACLVETISWGHKGAPAVAGALLLVPIIAVSFSLEEALGWVAIACALLAVALLWAVPRRGKSAGRSGRGGLLPAAAVTVCALGLAAAAPAVLVPHPEEGLFPTGSRFIAPGSSSGVNPVLDLSRDLRSPISQTVLQYATTNKSPVYLRTSIIEDLLDGSWAPPEGTYYGYTQDTPLTAPTDAVTWSSQPLPDHVPSAEAMAGTGYSPEALRSGLIDDYNDGAAYGPDTTEAKIEAHSRLGVSALAYSSPWLPLPSGTIKANALPSSYEQLNNTGVLRQASNAPVIGGEFSVLASGPPTAEQLAGSPSLRATLQKAIDSGTGPSTQDGGALESAEPVQSDVERIPESVRRLASTIVSDANAQASPVEIADALRDHLRGGDYNYTLRAPITENGHTGGLDVVERFLQSKSGYCVHFATTMVLMAKSQGIPARLALGYAPGKATGGNATLAGVEGPLYDVDSRNAHAWAQLYFVGVGWVDFDPTPGRAGTATDLEEEGQQPSAPASPSTSASNPTPGASDPRPSANPSPSAGSGAATPTPTPGAAQGAQPSNAGEATPGWVAAAGWWALGAVALAALVLAPVLWLRARRRATWRLIDDGGPGAAGAAWELLERRAAGSRGKPEPSAPAPERAATWFPDEPLASAAARLASARDRELFAPAAKTPQGSAAGTQAAPTLDGRESAALAATPSLGTDLRALLSSLGAKVPPAH